MKEIIESFIGNDNDWVDKLVRFLNTPEMKANLAKLTEIKKTSLIIPEQKDMFNAFKYCQFNDVKVVILSQDPYHTITKGKMVANGLAFSYKPVDESDKTCPPSLRNIFKEINEDVYEDDLTKWLDKDEITDLTRWAKQGVLLLNTALTVEQNKPGCHAAIWEPFTAEVLKTLSVHKTTVIYVLWGAHAQSYKKYINPRFNYILEAAHPSPFSAHKGFFGCKHFSKINEILEELNGKENRIQW
jgi:uracil-DNA glycosylase